MFIGRTDVEAETPILWPPDAKAETLVLWPPYVKRWLIGKDSDAGRAWGQEEKGTTEDEMAGWHHRLNGREFAQAPGVGDGQGGLECCDSWGRRESDMTEQLNWTELEIILETDVVIMSGTLIHDVYNGEKSFPYMLSSYNNFQKMRFAIKYC